MINQTKIQNKIIIPNFNFNRFDETPFDQDQYWHEENPSNFNLIRFLMLLFFAGFAFLFYLRNFSASQNKPINQNPDLAAQIRVINECELPCFASTSSRALFSMCMPRGEQPRERDRNQPLVQAQSTGLRSQPQSQRAQKKGSDVALKRQQTEKTILNLQQKVIQPEARFVDEAEALGIPKNKQDQPIRQRSHSIESLAAALKTFFPSPQKIKTVLKNLVICAWNSDSLKAEALLVKQAAQNYAQLTEENGISLANFVDEISKFKQFGDATPSAKEKQRKDQAFLNFQKKMKSTLKVDFN